MALLENNIYFFSPVEIKNAIKLNITFSFNFYLLLKINVYFNLENVD